MSRFAALIAVVCLCWPTMSAGASDGGVSTVANEPSPLWTQKPKPKGLSYGGQISSLFVPDLIMRGPYEDRFEWDLDARFRVKYAFAKNARFVVGARFRYELRAGDRLESDAWFDLGETYLQFRKGKLAVRVGRVVLTWGRNAVLSPLNQLNPLDLQRAFQPDGALDARIPVLAVRANVNLYPVSLEALWIPLYQPSRFSFYGRDFSAFRPGMLEEALPGLAPQSGIGLVDDAVQEFSERAAEALVSLDPYARDGLQSYMVFNRPEEFPWNGDLGARIGLTGRGVDGDLVVLWHVLDTPQISMHDALRQPLLESRLPTSSELTQVTNPGAELTQSTYHRSVLTGADIAVAAGGFVFSGEAAYETKGVFYRRDLTTYLSPRFRYAVAARGTHGTWAAFTLEFAHDMIVKPQDDTFLSRVHDFQLAFIGTLRFFQETFQLTLSANYRIAQRDLYLHPKITVELDDRIRVNFGMQIFEGFAGEVESNLPSLLAYRGGLYGYFTGNDHAYASVDFRF